MALFEVTDLHVEGMGVTRSLLLCHATSMKKGSLEVLRGWANSCGIRIDGADDPAHLATSRNEQGQD